MGQFELTCQKSVKPMTPQICSFDCTDQSDFMVSKFQFHVAVPFCVESLFCCV